VKIKTSELKDWALGWATAAALGLNPGTSCDATGYYWAFYYDGKAGGYIDALFHQDWSKGGPIIEREGITWVFEGDASPSYELGDRTYYAKHPLRGLEFKGPTPLIAAMRCFVASRLGEEIDVPEELHS
jgi:hypothetical protein